MQNRKPRTGQASPDSGAAAQSAPRYAESLLAECQAQPGRAPVPGFSSRALDPAREWARSGAMALTGEAKGPPRLAPGPLASVARGAALALAALAPRSPSLAKLDGPALLGERAALMRLGRRGAVAPGGGCRLLPAQDAWLALNLARPEDRDLLPAWLEAEPTPDEDAWNFAARVLGQRSAHSCIERGRLMGLAVAPAAGAPATRTPWLLAESIGPGRRPPRPGEQPQVLDLSALWAGPLCAQLLGSSGARVIKLESQNRPDGARHGEPRFFDLLNAGKQSVAVDLGTQAGIRRLRELIACADIVVESARPRALAQFGIDPAAGLRARPGQVWVSITAYGRRGAQGNWAGFGDDVAMAAGAGVRAGTGLGVGTDPATPATRRSAIRDNAPAFCGDAIADPLTGLHAAVAALAHWQTGRSALLDISLHAVTRSALTADREVASPPNAAVRMETVAPPTTSDSPKANWRVVTAGGTETVAPPRARPPGERAAALGADNARARFVSRSPIRSS
jgi:crotonobetainyl-CoA:carnitine CoA-transferase CaiB-like acyl-CoA transferase